MERYIQETKDAIKWFKMNDIVAWVDTDQTSVYIKLNNDTNVLVSGSEVSYRANLYRFTMSPFKNYKNKNKNK